MKLPVIRAVQKGVTLYIGKIDVGSLLEKCVITEWDPNLGWDIEKQGYQRAPNQKHYTRIANFLVLEGSPLLPTAALLSAREQDYGILQFTGAGVTGNSDFGFLEIPNDRRLFIVDYQHRWRGFKKAIEEIGKKELSDVQIPFILMANATTYEEMRQFYLINDKQRHVDTDLALALMLTMATKLQEPQLLNLVGPGKRYRIRATRLTFKIAALQSGCWVARIAEPNNPQLTDVASPKSFADSLRPIISNRSPVCTKSDDSLVSILTAYWEGIQILMPEAFKSPQAFAIQKTTGLFVMHRVAARKVFSLCYQRNNFSATTVSQILQSATKDYLNANFWRTGGQSGAYGGTAGHKALADLILSTIR